MAWGYWSASSVIPDRGRSPRRAGTSVSHSHPNPPTAREVLDSHDDQSIIHTASTSRDSREHSASPHSSSNGAGPSHHQDIRHTVRASELFGESYGELSRRPSLDLGSVRSAIEASCSGGGTLSAGSTLTRGGTLADYLPPPAPCPHHHRVYVDHHKHSVYEQPIQPLHVGVSHSHAHSRASSRHQTDDEDDLEPAYATGMFFTVSRGKSLCLG